MMRAFLLLLSFSGAWYSGVYRKFRMFCHFRANEIWSPCPVDRKNTAVGFPLRARLDPIIWDKKRGIHFTIPWYTCLAVPELDTEFNCQFHPIPTLCNLDSDPYPCHLRGFGPAPLAPNTTSLLSIPDLHHLHAAAMAIGFSAAEYTSSSQ